MAYTVSFTAKVNGKRKRVSFKAKGSRPVPGLDEAAKVGTCVAVKQGKRKGPAMILCKTGGTKAQKRHGLRWTFKRKRGG